jgi:hypothetical protein
MAARSASWSAAVGVAHDLPRLPLLPMAERGDEVTRRNLTAAELARQLAALLGQPDQAANDDEPEIDRDAIRERARRTAEWMRRSRNQG